MKTKKRISFRMKLTLLTSITYLVIGLASTISGVSSIEKSLYEQVNVQLQNNIVNVESELNTISKDPYSISEGKLYKGEYEVSNFSSEAEKLKEKIGVDITIFMNDTRIASTIKSAIGTKADETIWDTVKNGETYFDKNVLINGNPYFGYYEPIIENSTVVGMYFTGQPQESVSAKIEKSINQLIILNIILQVIICVVVQIFISGINKRIKLSTTAIKELSNKNLSIKLDKNIANDEIGDIYHGIEELRVNMYDILSNISESSVDIGNSVNELDNSIESTRDTSNSLLLAVEEIANSATQQAEDTTNAAGKVNDIGLEINRTKDIVKDLNESTKNMTSQKDEVSRIMSLLTEDNKKSKEIAMQVDERIKTTVVSFEDIKILLKTINKITAQTKLLALNASIEAARAGEQGKGFTVVAEEVGKLANESEKSSKEIENTLLKMDESLNHMTNVISDSKIISEKQSDEIQETDNNMLKLSNEINSIIDKILQVNQKMEYIDSNKVELLSSIESLAAISEENAATTEESTAVVNETNNYVNNIKDQSTTLHSIAKELVQSVEKFVL